MGSGFMPWPSERAACVTWTRKTPLVGRRLRFAARHRAGEGLSVLLQPTVQATGPAWLRPGPPALQPRYRDNAPNPPDRWLERSTARPVGIRSPWQCWEVNPLPRNRRYEPGWDNAAHPRPASGCWHAPAPTGAGWTGRRGPALPGRPAARLRRARCKDAAPPVHRGTDTGCPRQKRSALPPGLVRTAPESGRGP